MTFATSIARHRPFAACLVAITLSLAIASDSVAEAVHSRTQHICVSLGTQLAQDCGQPQCPPGQAPCKVHVGPAGKLCWTCCPA